MFESKRACVRIGGTRLMAMVAVVVAASLQAEVAKSAPPVIANLFAQAPARAGETTQRSQPDRANSASASASARSTPPTASAKASPSNSDDSQSPVAARVMDALRKAAGETYYPTIPRATHTATGEFGLYTPSAARQTALQEGDDETGEGDLGEGDLIRQTPAQALEKSRGCLTCHSGVERMHKSEAVNLGCVDCHGGDPNTTIKECAHVPPRFPEYWTSSANPVRSFALLNLESPEFVRFINPGDWRAAHKSCGTAGCHTEDVHVNRKSIMGHTAMVPGSALYNNGSVPNKIYRWGEVYSEGGLANRVFSTPQPTIDEYYNKGILPWIDPMPHFEMTQPGNVFRVLEIDNNATSVRGPGTDFRQDAVFLNVVKTKLNDPTMVFLGTCDNPGDYRSSGCTSCHVLYANDRDPAHSAYIAQFGNRGFSATGDPTIPKDEPGHPIRHTLTRAIPSSQCMTCHFHQGSGALGNYYGYMWWDYETDADQVYPRYGMPQPSGYIGTKGNESMQDVAPTVNPRIQGNEFADYHNAGWLMQAVYLRNKKGKLLDAQGDVIPSDARDWHDRAVHMSDIHLQKGMHCVDCHFKQDSHGDGKLYGAMIDAIEINCQDCHGTVQEHATLVTSNHPGGNDLTRGLTPFGQQRFVRRGDRVFQRSSVTPGLEWEVVQVKDIITPGHPYYNESARYAKTIERDGKTWGRVEAEGEECRRAHSDSKITCYSCHSAWNNSCAGCHLDATTNRVADVLHYEGGFSKVYAAYNPQVNRSDGYFLGINGVVKGSRVSPVRSASGVVVSAAAGNRQMVVHQQPTIAAEGHAGHAFSPNPPHTVGPAISTRKCSSCHVSENGDNNATVAAVLGLGTRATDFVGRYVWVAERGAGIEAVRVTSSESFPSPVIGSNMQRLVDPQGFRAHYANSAQLLEAYGHVSQDARSIVSAGEWTLVADGPRGLRVFDKANIHNKDEAQHIVTSLIGPLGQRQRLPSSNATCVALATVLPMEPDRSRRPENLEQPIHPLYGYAYVTDFNEGLILVDIIALFDGNPSNNFLERTVTFNPDGILNGAVYVKIHGEYAYVLTCDNGLVVVNISNPCEPVLCGRIGGDAIVAPTAIDFQFRYGFLTDSEGLKVIDVTDPCHPAIKAVVPMRDAREVVIMRTYAYIAAGADGLAVLDVESPEQPGELRYFTAGGCINDTSAVVVGALYGSLFAYVADGQNGLRVVQLISPADGHEAKGASPDPVPRLIATYPTKGPAVALAPGMPRDHYVDIDGNQFNVFGRLGSRPFNREELRRMFLRNGRLYTVSDTPPGPPVDADDARVETARREK